MPFEVMCHFAHHLSGEKKVEKGRVIPVLRMMPMRAEFIASFSVEPISYGCESDVPFRRGLQRHY